MAISMNWGMPLFSKVHDSRDTIHDEYIIHLGGLCDYLFKKLSEGSVLNAKWMTKKSIIAAMSFIRNTGDDYQIDEFFLSENQVQDIIAAVKDELLS